MKKYFLLATLYTITCSQLTAQLLSISGTVNQSSGVLGNGIAFAINRSNRTTKIDKIINGNYTVDSINSGNYIVYAIPDPSSKAYLPTYFLSKQNPEQANSFDLIGIASNVNIFLLTKTSSETGTATLNLRFTYRDISNDDSQDFSKKWFELPAPPSTISMPGSPCQTLPVLLYNQQNQIVDWGVTDNEGYVQFKNLAGGVYYAHAQRYEYVTQNQGYVNLPSGSTSTIGLRLGEGAITALEGENIVGSTCVFPNPFKDQLSISGFEGSVTVMDLTGAVYYSNPFFTQPTIATTDWPKGIYLLRLGDKVHKLLKY